MISNKQPFDWVPTPELIASSNLTTFLRKVGEPRFEDLAARADADPAWLMQEVFEFCDFRFFKPYTQMLDTSRGIEWG
ncbi:MAG: AMP-dependent synthetase, partial [Hydrogenophaga sp.]|nr:AMP-dependent synthetase [Hydrogenophaga sp.]